VQPLNGANCSTRRLAPTSILSTQHGTLIQPHGQTTCAWHLGSRIPGTKDTFRCSFNSEFGSLLQLTYPGPRFTLSTGSKISGSAVLIMPVLRPALLRNAECARNYLFARCQSLGKFFESPAAPIRIRYRNGFWLRTLHGSCLETQINLRIELPPGLTQWPVET